MAKNSKLKASNKGLKHLPKVQYIDKPVRTVLGRLFIALKRWALKRGQIQVIFKMAGYYVTDRTLNNWAESVLSTGSAVMENPLSGAKEKLNDSQSRIVVGYVLSQNNSNLMVSRKTVVNFVHSQFDISVSNEWARLFLKANGFAKRNLLRRKSGYVIDDVQLAQLHCAWVKEHRDKIFKGYDYSHIVSLDFTMTGHRTDSPTTYAVKGG